LVKALYLADELRNIKISKGGMVPAPCVLGIYFRSGECKLAAKLV
jgi:hypothetical protein